MKVGLTLSVAGHVALIALASGFSIFSNSESFDEMTFQELDVDIVSEEEFVTLVNPEIEEIDQAVEIETDLILITPEEDSLQPIEIPEFPIEIADLTLPEQPSKNFLENLDIPKFEPLESNNVPQEQITFTTPIPLPETKEIKMPEIKRVTSEFNPVPISEIKIADINQVVIKEVPSNIPETNTEEPTVTSVKEASSPVTSTEANKTEEASAPNESQTLKNNLLTAGTPLTRPSSDAQLQEIEELVKQVSQQPTQSTKVFVRKTLTNQERSQLVSKIENSWNLGSLSREASLVTVTVEFRMDQTGKPFDIKLVSYTGNSKTAADVAFEAARRAITRGLREGIDLPKEKYENWKNVKMTFNPESMRTR